MKRTSMPIAAACALVALILSHHALSAQSSDISVVVSPSTISLDSKGVWVTVHAEIEFGLVVGASVELDGIPVTATFADDRGDLVAKFCLDDVKALVEPGVATLTLTGFTKSGEAFSGSDTVRVVAR